MFKKGDIIVCVDNNEDYRSYNPSIKMKLTIDKRYTVIDTKFHTMDSFVIIKNDIDEITGYNEYRFINLKEYRKRKLNILNLWKN